MLLKLIENDDASQETFDKVDPLEAAFLLRQAINRCDPIDLPAPEVCRKIRERWGLSRNQAALVIGVQPLQLVRWERGWAKPTAEHAARWGQLLAFLLSLEDAA